MKSLIIGTSLLFTFLAAACTPMDTHQNWLDNAPKIDEENSHK